MKIQLQAPKATALHTAGEKIDQEYDWFVKDVELFDTIAMIHRLLLRDVGGEPPRLAVLMQKQRIGFLIGDMPSPRRDYYGNRIIYNTLYLEYSLDHKAQILNYFTHLLLCSIEQYSHIEQSFTNYAEWLYGETRENPPELPEFDEKLLQNQRVDIEDQWIWYNDLSHRQRCACYLQNIAQSAIDTLFCVITGRVSIERCQQAVKNIDQIQPFIILTRASEMEKKEEVKLSETLTQKSIAQIKAIPQLLENFIRGKW